MFTSHKRATVCILSAEYLVERPTKYGLFIFVKEKDFVVLVLDQEHLFWQQLVFRSVTWVLYLATYKRGAVVLLVFADHPLELISSQTHDVGVFS